MFLVFGGFALGDAVLFTGDPADFDLFSDNLLDDLRDARGRSRHTDSVEHPRSNHPDRRAASVDPFRAAFAVRSHISGTGDP